jgi:hypothetical protein
VHCRDLLAEKTDDEPELPSAATAIGLPGLAPIPDGDITERASSR